MKTPFTLTIDEKSFSNLYSHLFPGDEDEHGAVICVGISESENGTRLLARDIFLAEDGIDYVPGKRGYRALTADFVAKVSDYCYDNKLGYLAVHCHGGINEASFSTDDYNSHKRGYPALLDITGEPVGALVFAKNAVAGEIWLKEGVYQLEYLKIIGSKIIKLYPSQLNLKQKNGINPIYDRHARLFGDVGQSILSNLKVGIIGLGGGGSLVNEWLSRLGVGSIIAIDFDKVESSNLPRIVGATRWDACTWLSNSKFKFLQNLGKRLSKYKVDVAQRVALKANPEINFEAVVGDILDEKTALKLKDVDFIFLASDTIKSRNVFNNLLHQYLIPGAQIGAKVRTDKNSKEVIEIFTAGRMVLPYQEGGCLYCNGWIPPGRLQTELLSEEDKKEQNYIENEVITEPSVITLNVLSAAQVINDFMMMFTGLYQSKKQLSHILNYILDREINTSELRHEIDCLHCSTHKKSKFAKGDRSKLACRQKRE